MTQRVLVVDDDRGNISLVRTYLEKSNFEVLVAHDGETALRILRRERPDLVLLDLVLPERDGWDVTGAMRGDEGLAAMPVIMLTGPVEKDGKLALRGQSEAVAKQLHSTDLELGADDEMSKPFYLGEVVARMRTVLQRAQGESTSSRLIQVGELTVDLDARQVKVGGQTVRLTPTEFALLRALAEQPGHTLTRQEMIEKGLGCTYEGLERTVDSHIKNLRQKLNESGSAAYMVETVFGIGYRLALGDRAESL